MTITTPKTSFKKKPKVISYRDFKSFSQEVFQLELRSNLSLYDTNNISFDFLDGIAMYCVNKHALPKYKYLRANEGVFMNKELSKDIMYRSKLKYICHKSRTKNRN